MAGFGTKNLHALFLDLSVVAAENVNNIMNRKRELLNISKSYKLVYESTGFNKGSRYRCEDIFKNSDPSKHHFFYVKAGYDLNKYQSFFRKLKKQSGSNYFEVYGFKNLTNPKMEYHFNYLFRTEIAIEILQKIYSEIVYDRGITYVSYSDKEVVVPENNEEALDDEMECDFFLPNIAMKSKTREHFGDIMGSLG